MSPELYAAFREAGELLSKIEGLLLSRMVAVEAEANTLRQRVSLLERLIAELSAAAANKDRVA